MAFTNIPDVPLYTGSAPNRNTQQQAEFSTNSDDSLQYQATLADNINTTSAAMSAVANEVQVVADDAQDSADSATASAAASASNANFKGKWVDQSGAANIPYSVSHAGDNWQLLSNIADVTASEPSTANADWIVIIGQLVIIARSLNVLDSEVIYSDDTATSLDNVLFIYDSSNETAWTKPDVGAGEFIDTVVGSQLTTDIPTVYTMTQASVEDVKNFPLLSTALSTETIKEGMTLIIKELGSATFDVVTGESASPYYIYAHNSLPLQLKMRIEGVAKLPWFGVPDVVATNVARCQAANDIANTLNAYVDPNVSGNILLNATIAWTVPISSDNAMNKTIFEQTDDSISVMTFASELDFFEPKGFTAMYTNNTSPQTAPAIVLLNENHNVTPRNIRTLGGTYGIHSDQVSFWQTYENCRCDNYDLAQMRIDGNRNDLTGGGTTINLTNCGGFSDKTTIADAALVLNSISEVYINTYEFGQGKMKSLILADSVFNLNITNPHWELSEVTQSAFNIANCSLCINGLYMQDIKIPTATTVPLIFNFKSTVQISNITKRGTAPAGTLELMTAAQAAIMNNSDTVIELSGSIDLDDFTMTGDYDDVEGNNQSITSNQLMRVDAPKVRAFSMSSVSPDTVLNFPFNGSKPSFMQITLGGSTQGVTNIFDGSTAVISELTGGGETTAAAFRYRWNLADGTVGAAAKDIQIICQYPKGWYAL